MTSTPHQRSAPAWSLALWIRKIHTYAGALFAPAIVFFAVTGVLQVYHLHRNQPANGYQAPALIQMFGMLHKDQMLRPPKGEPGGPARAASISSPDSPRPHKAHKSHDGDEGGEVSQGGPAAVPGAMAAGPAAPAPPRPTSFAQALLKAYVAAMGICLTLTTLLGLYLGLQSRRERVTVAILLAVGLIAPAALLLV